MSNWEDLPLVVIIQRKNEERKNERIIYIIDNPSKYRGESFDSLMKNPIEEGIRICEIYGKRLIITTEEELEGLLESLRPVLSRNMENVCYEEYRKKF